MLLLMRCILKCIVKMKYYGLKVQKGEFKVKIKDFTSTYEGKFSLENVENREGFYLFENLESSDYNTYSRYRYYDDIEIKKIFNIYGHIIVIIE